MLGNLSPCGEDEGVCSLSSEVTSPPWTPSEELRDSLVDMYTAYPEVNEELRQRLPLPATHQPGDSTHQPRDSTHQPGDSTHQPGDSTHQPRDSTHQPRDSTHQPRDSTHQPRDSERPIGPSSCPPSPLSLRRSLSPGGQMDLVSASRGPSPRAESRGDGGPSLQRHLPSPEDSSHQEVVFGPITASGRAQSLDRDKNISFLLKELDALRDVNKRLQEELLQKEKELQRREVEEQLREERREERSEERREERSEERPAELLQQVLSAQKDRDQALMSRILLANQERDEALLRAQQLQHTEWEGAPPLDADMDVEAVLQALSGADSVQVQQLGSVLMQRLRSARQRRVDIIAQEMKAVMDERDGSVAMCKRLEQEVMQERERRASETERLRAGGGALDNKRRLEAELQLLRTNHIPPDPFTASQPGDTVSSAPPLQVQQAPSEEKRSVEAELQRCQEGEREAKERVQRLERLVEVLRKKVGTGSVRAVM
ncbi:hypothetical protein CesoFtcFv8_018024 [Champsocephalus esox]|uniref:Mirror-image polydactyly 1 n=1 Tax=Champsocephalus esox TaxID=159716 RepID=A0AAN8BL13_9TELE|nr:hypothetical protein CesoFtcFv8_018024 [Champsocephalus esox]